MICDKLSIKNIIETTVIKPGNFKIIEGEVVQNKWRHEITHVIWSVYNKGVANIILSCIDNETYKIINNNGEIKYLNKTEIIEIALSGGIANCEVINKLGNKVCMTEDVIQIYTDKKFEDEIKLKYKKFITKAKLIGLDISFTYTIENGEVKFAKYLGSSSKLIIPDFITTILNGAMSFKGLTEITIPEGIKYIGRGAFIGNNLKQIVIPETTHFIGKHAVENRNILKLKNDRTLVM